MELLSFLVERIGVPLTLLVFFGYGMYRLLFTMQATRLEMVQANASRIEANAEFTTNASKMALLSQQQNMTLTDKLEAALKVINETGREVERLRARVEALEREKSNNQGEIARLLHRVTELEAELIKVRNELETERNANDLLQKVVQQVKDERDGLAAQMSSLEVQLRLLSKRLAALDTQELQTLSKEIEAIETKERASEKVTHVGTDAVGEH